jgi:hypothetical protein
MQLPGRGREMTLSVCSEPRRVIRTGVYAVTLIHCCCRVCEMRCAYTLLVLNYMSHAPLPNHYTSPCTKRPSVPGLCCHESTLLHHNISKF